VATTKGLGLGLRSECADSTPFHDPPPTSNPQPSPNTTTAFSTEDTRERLVLILAHHCFEAVSSSIPNFKERLDRTACCGACGWGMNARHDGFYADKDQLHCACCKWVLHSPFTGGCPGANNGGVIFGHGGRLYCSDVCGLTTARTKKSFSTARAKVMSRLERLRGANSELDELKDSEKRLGASEEGFNDRLTTFLSKYFGDDDTEDEFLEFARDAMSGRNMTTVEPSLLDVLLLLEVLKEMGFSIDGEPQPQPFRTPSRTLLNPNPNH
jgi:hypothetical protein